MKKVLAAILALYTLPAIVLKDVVGLIISIWLIPVTIVLVVVDTYQRRQRRKQVNEAIARIFKHLDEQGEV